MKRKVADKFEKAREVKRKEILELRREKAMEVFREVDEKVEDDREGKPVDETPHYSCRTKIHLWRGDVYSL